MKTKDIIKAFAIAAIMALTLSSCDYLPEIVNKETALNFSLAERGCAYLKIAASPADERVYYTYDLFLKEDYDSLGLTEEQYMKAVLDTLTKEYNEMRDLMDPGRKETYFGSFADYALYYSVSQKTFSGLAPGEQYVLLGFCVNKDNYQPMGHLNTMEFKTLSLEETKESDMKFDFMILDVIDQDNNETRVYCKPTNSGGNISKDIYVSGYVYPLDSLNKHYGGDIEAYISDYITEFTDAGLIDISIHSDIHEDVYLHSLETLVEGKQYVMWACPYSLDFLDKYQTLTFTYTEGMRIDYTHDKK